MISTDSEPCASLNCGEDAAHRMRALRVEADLFRLPPALERMNQLLSAGPVDLRRLGGAMAEAPDLAADTLRLCNSSLFGLAQPVASLEQAVIVVDAEMVRCLLLACWLIRYSGAHVIAQENRQFWRHSLLVAQLSRSIGERLDCSQPERVFVAGLLHDVGTLPFLTLVSREGSAGERGILHDVGDAIEPQRRRFGIDHCELGLKMASILGFPVAVVETVARHHQRGPALSCAPPVCFVSAAEMISQMRSAMEKSDEWPAAAKPAIRSALAEYLPGLSGSVISSLVDELESDLRTASQWAEVSGDVWTDSFPLAPAPDRAEPRREAAKPG